MALPGKRLTVEHAVRSGRSRLRLAGLRGNPVLAGQIEALLGDNAHWHAAEVRVATGSIILHCKPGVSAEAAAACLAAALAASAGTAGTPAGAVPGPVAGAVTGAVSGAGAAPADPAAGDGAWHSLAVSDVARSLATDAVRGLRTDAAQARLAAEGRNLVPRPPRQTRLAALAAQFDSLPVLLLAGSAVVSMATGGAADAIATLAVVGVNGVLGFLTEGEAERVIGALTTDDGTATRVRVIRDGEETEIAAADLVRGDLYRVSAGLQVAADARLVETVGLTVDESVLTGETLPAEKRSAAEVGADAPLGARPTMLHAGTLVADGRGTGLVTATGARTVSARIARLGAAASRPRAPIEAALDRIGRRLALVALGACGLLFGIGWMRGRAVAGLMRDTLALAVAAVPEGLPVVATTTMALGLRRMERRGILIRRIDAVESLGALQTICLDKTGTLTQNRMQVIGAAPGLAEVPLSDTATLRALAEAAALNNDGWVGNGVRADGASATERALLDFAARCGVDVGALRARHARTGAVERAPQRPWMATVHAGRGARTVVKGAPEAVLARCTRISMEGKVRPMAEADRSVIRALNDRLAAHPARLLGFAEGDRDPDGDEVEGLTWLGLVAMVDPLRPGAAGFIAALHHAGLDTVMITGDQSATAAAIARDLDLARGRPLRIIDAPAIADMAPDLLAALARQAHVFARVSADQKLAIVQALQRSGRVVAMTGDGVNDAPALKAADIGIAMGASGTVLARDVANVVIRDDELGTLVDAIAQGRAVYRNIRRALQFLITTNASEIAVSLVEALHGPNELETAMELLWINLVTDVLPGLGLALADPDPDVMAAPPRAEGEPIFPPDNLRRIAIDSGTIAASALAAHFVGLARYGPGPRTRGITYLSLSMGQLLYTLTCQRTDVRRLAPGRLLENRPLDRAVLVSGGLALLPFLMPPLGRLLGVARLGPRDMALGLAAAALPAAAVLARRGIVLRLHPLEDGA